MPDEVVETPFGKFLVNPQDCVGTTLKAGTLWDGPGFLQVIAREHAGFGEPGTTVLDVGANIGAFSVYCAGQGAWRVIAVEPVPVTMQRLKANLDLNKDTCAEVVVPIEVAGYNRSTTLACPEVNLDNLGGTALGAPALTGTIAARALDDYRWLFGQRVSLIKIDTQGCDGAVIQGLLDTIERHHPVIVFEWEADLVAPHGVSWDALQMTLGLAGYQIHPWPSQPNNFLALWGSR